jgi:phenylacetic acid degradation operon negative regulatory protein
VTLIGDIILNGDGRQTALQTWRNLPSARALALGFLSTARSEMRVADLVRRADVVGLDGAAMRVALGRLCREGVVQQVERGLYAIGPAGAALDRRARGWADAASRVRDWNGRWVIVLADHLGRSDRRLVRRRERALTLFGFVATAAGAWVRPDNLAAPLADLVAQLQAIGLDADAVTLGDAVALEDAAWRALWPVAAIETGYRFWIGEMEASLERIDMLATDAAARETLLLGQSVIRAINRDPLLPGALIDTALRDDMVAAMRRYDVAGKACWAKID